MPARIATDPQHKKEIVAMGALQHEHIVGLKDIVYQVGLGRVVASGIEAPNLFVNLV